MVTKSKRLIMEKVSEVSMPFRVFLGSESQYKHEREHIAEILKNISSKYPDSKINKATLYRTLSFSEEQNLVSSITFKHNGQKSYEANTQEHHDHLICISCGTIIEFVEDEIEELQNKIAKEHDFYLLSHSLNLYGLCQKCSKTDRQNR